MTVEDIINIEAPPDEVWAIITNVEQWPGWTPTVTSVIRLDEGPFRLGSTAKIKQPSQPMSEWTVTEFVSGERFVWETRRLGLKMRGSHEVKMEGKGTIHTNRLEAVGIIAKLLVPILRSTIPRVLSEENQRLKAKCENTNSATLHL